MIMEYGSRVLLAVLTLAIGWWLINKLTHKVGRLLALRFAFGLAWVGRLRQGGLQDERRRSQRSIHHA